MRQGDHVPPTPLDDLSCDGCGYLLRGMQRDDDCPECGLPIEASIHARRLRRRVANDLGPIRKLTGCMTVLCIGCLLILLPIIFGIGRPSQARGCMAYLMLQEKPGRPATHAARGLGLFRS